MATDGDEETRAVDDGVQLEVHGEAKERGCPVPALLLKQHERAQNEQAQYRLGAAPGRDVGDDGIQQPNRADEQRRLVSLDAALDELDVEKRADHEVREGEEHLGAEGMHENVGRRDEGEEGRVAVRVARVGIAEGAAEDPRGVAAVVARGTNDAARGVRKDDVVDVGVLDGAARVLHSAPDEEREPEARRGGEERWERAHRRAESGNFGLDEMRRVTVSYEAVPGSGDWERIQPNVERHLPLTNLHWKSGSRSIRTIQSLALDLQPFSTFKEDAAAPVRLLERPYLHLLFVVCDVRPPPASVAHRRRTTRCTARPCGSRSAIGSTRSSRCRTRNGSSSTSPPGAPSAASFTSARAPSSTRSAPTSTRARRIGTSIRVGYRSILISGQLRAGVAVLSGRGSHRLGGVYQARQGGHHRPLRH